ncbi:MAG: M6 family metalloprotease domain-containing protein [Bacteroidetes bacterium]|nr:M6 family metalloprotease domain-containing protein [Bacteroidota bacterium]
MKNFVPVLLMLWCASVAAMPAKRTPTVVAQPDGSTFSIVGFGDERYNYAETLDGYVVIQGSDEYWYYATLNPEGRFVPSAFRIQGNNVAPQQKMVSGVPKHLRESSPVIASRMRMYELERTASEGTLRKSILGPERTENGVKRVLILCVEFSNLAATQTSASFQEMVNNDSWKSGVGGMSKYYKDVSYNMLSLQADGQDWITAAEASAYYAFSNADFGIHIQELVSQCIDAAEANGVDFSLYDNDGDGEVDGLFIVHSGKGAEEGNQTQYIWSHSGGLNETYARTYDGMYIGRYIIMPEMYGAGHVDIGVFCHEYGHMLGLPDLYDTNDASNGESEGIGNWCLMATGGWGGDGSSPERPTHMSAYCKELLGLTTPTVLAASQGLSVPQAETNSFAYKIWMDDNQSDEYMLVENREKTGFDLDLPASGLLIYHIDKNLVDIWPASNRINVASAHLGVKVYEADGLEQMATGANRGNAGDPYPGSTGQTNLTSVTSPNTALWNMSPSGVEITGISAPATTMTAAAVLPIYYGYNRQFYRQLTGRSYGSSELSSGYGMVRCIPAYDGKLVGLRVFSPANRFTTVSAAVFSVFSGNELSSQVGGSVSGASAGVDNFIQMNFSPEIAVTKDEPVYVRVFFQRASGGFALPIDVTSPATGDSYYSSNGTSYSSMSTSDLAVRVVFRSNSALPVELVSFSASTKGPGVVVSWQTASEVNNYGFEVEKDTARAQPVFTTIPGSFVPGHGTSVASHVYTFVDSSATQGRWAYRLKQIDLDGTVHLSEPVLVDLATTDAGDDPALPTTYTLQQNYPNPFNPNTIITYALPASAYVQLCVLDVLGREVSRLVDGTRTAGTYRVDYDAAGLSSGVYFYRLSTSEFTQTRRMLLVK